MKVEHVNDQQSNTVLQPLNFNAFAALIRYITGSSQTCSSSTDCLLSCLLGLFFKLYFRLLTLCEVFFSDTKFKACEAIGTLPIENLHCPAVIVKTRLAFVFGIPAFNLQSPICPSL